MPGVKAILFAQASDGFRSRTPGLLHACAGQALWMWSAQAAREAGCDELIFVAPARLDQALKGAGSVVRSLDEALQRTAGSAVLLLALEAALAGSALMKQAVDKARKSGQPVLPHCEDGGEGAPVFGAFPASALAELRARKDAGEVLDGFKDALRVEAACHEAHFQAWDRQDLADAEQELRAQINEAWMQRGVTLRDPASTFIDATVKIGAETVVEPFSFLQGSSVIGKGCLIGPFSRVINSRVDDGAQVVQSVVEDSRVGPAAQVGPWSRLRPGSDVGEEAHVGNFVELKKSRLGKGVKAGHLSYLGDAEVGEGANIGAGTITANYDGKAKHPTLIGKRAFVGSGTVLVAPVSLGEGAMTGAGSVVLKGRDVPKGGVVAGVPAKPLGPKKGKKR
jgi:bifunctional N-acetylglucosamine-1-phosphate-uridyltransferase/glucosamine-1-phosphate-acetyltransferase GlmU-like protein